MILNHFAEYPGSYFFTSFINNISNIIVRDRIGFEPSDNYTYVNTSLGLADQSIIREIIWDMIIDRHLTIGGAGHDEWPNFTVTERGKVYFNSHKKDI